MRERLLHVLEILVRRRWNALVIGVVGAIATIILGFFGFQEYYARPLQQSDEQAVRQVTPPPTLLPVPIPAPQPPDQPAPQPTWSTTLYLAVQLLILQSGAVSGPVPWQLEISRVFAPIFTAVATIAALITVFAEQLAVWRLQIQRDHIVVCGIGRKGRLIVEDLLDWGYSVVAVEPYPLESGLAALHQRGLHVVTGDATDRNVLRRAGAHRAKAIVAACGNDASNIDIAHQAEMLPRASSAAPLRLYVHLQEPNLQSLLESVGKAAALTDPGWHFFNVYDRAAESILAKYFVYDRETVRRRTRCDVWRAATHQPVGGAPADVPSHPHAEPLTVEPGCEPRLAVIGDALLADSLIENIVQEWRPRQEQRNERLGLVLIGDAAARRLSVLRGKIPGLDAVCDVTLMNQSLSELTLEARRKALHGVTTVYVCQRHDPETAATALSLWQETSGEPTRIIAGFDRQFGLAKLVQNVGMAAKQRDMERLITFSIGESCRLADRLLDRETKGLAERVHANWLRKRLSDSPTTAGNTFLDLTNAAAQDAALQSSLQQIQHAPYKLEQIGCTIKREEKPDPKRFTWKDGEIAELAKLEHDRWNNERLLNGWELGPRDNAQKIHNNLTPWECVPREIQQYDIDAVVNLPTLFAEVGFEIIRRTKLSEAD